MNNLRYLKKENGTKKLLRTEILFTPILIVTPLIIGIMLVRDYYIRGYIEGNGDFFGQLLVGLTIIIVNILFFVPFIKSLFKLSKNSK